MSLLPLSSHIVQQPMCMLVSHTTPNLITVYPVHFWQDLNSLDISRNWEFCITYVPHLGILFSNDFLFPHLSKLQLKILNSLVHRVMCQSQVQFGCQNCLCTAIFILQHKHYGADWVIEFQFLSQIALTWNSLADQLLCKY